MARVWAALLPAIMAWYSGRVYFCFPCERRLVLRACQGLSASSRVCPSSAPGPSDSPVGLRPSLLLPQGPKGCGFQCWKGWGASQTQGLVFWNLLRGHRPTRLGLHDHVPGYVHTRQNRVGGHAGGSTSQSSKRSEVRGSSTRPGLQCLTLKWGSGERAAAKKEAVPAHPHRTVTHRMLTRGGRLRGSGGSLTQPGPRLLPCSGVRERPPQQAGWPLNPQAQASPGGRTLCSASLASPSHWPLPRPAWLMHDPSRLPPSVRSTLTSPSPWASPANQHRCTDRAVSPTGRHHSLLSGPARPFASEMAACMALPTVCPRGTGSRGHPPGCAGIPSLSRSPPGGHS